MKKIKKLYFTIKRLYKNMAWQVDGSSITDVLCMLEDKTFWALS